MPSRRFGGPLFFVRWQYPSFLDSYPSLDPLISRTIPIKVLLINVSGCKKNFACLRYEQGFKNEKLVITNFQIFCKRQTLFFVVLRTRPKEDFKEKKFLFVWWLQTNCVILPNMKARYFPPPGGRTVVSFSKPSLPNMTFLDGVHFSSGETVESICKRWKVNNCTQNSVKKMKGHIEHYLCLQHTLLYIPV